MNSYTDLQIIECNRLHSEEAKSGNNENFSLWTNNLTDIVHLEAGDKVSVQGAFISERGAGQSSAIEIKGVELGIKKTFNFIEFQGTNASSELNSGFETIQANASTQQINIRDDTGYFNIQYYINANGHNYYQLPRRWVWNSSNSGVPNNWFEKDAANFKGMAYHDPFNSGYGGVVDTFVLFDDYYQTTINGSLTKLRNNNDRYTLMVRDKTYFSESNASGNLPKQYLRDPENAIYHTYTELKKIEVPKGFNSPQYISDEITKQLQKVEKEVVLQVRNASDSIHNASLPGFPVPVYKTFETETFKTFNVASIYKYEGNLDNAMEKDYNYYINNGSTDAGTNASGWEWLSQYQVIACKRPEIYEKGRLVNRSLGHYRGILGSQLDYQYDGTNSNAGVNGIITTIEYTKENCEILRDFILAQQKYPEIWNIFSDPRTGYNDGDTIENSIWFHMNRYNNDLMRLDPDASFPYTENAQLGWGGYINPAWNSNNHVQLASVIVPFKYDKKQKDNFYSYVYKSTTERGALYQRENRLSFGFIGMTDPSYKIEPQRIVLYPTDRNGIGSALFNMLDGGSGVIEAKRKIGFDMHFTAPGVGYIMPFSGYTTGTDTFDSRAFEKVGDWKIARNSDSTIMTDYQVNTQMLRRKLYIGADTPELNYDGTNFAFSKLHTGLNRGNDRRANNTYTNESFVADTEATKVVYKINPKEQFNDWTPARMPYVAQTFIQSDHSNASTQSLSHKFNENLEPWQIYDSLGGIFISDFNLSQNEWTGTLWDLLGFTYNQFHSSSNTRNLRVDGTNSNDLSIITTNSQFDIGDIKTIYQNYFGVPLYRNMIPDIATLFFEASSTKTNRVISYYPEIINEANSVQIVAEKLPTRMIRGYYTIRSNILEDNPFIGGKKNNVKMNIIGIVDKINGDGDFYFGQESSLEFTITKPLRLASIKCSVHDPDGSYSNTSEQNTILLKVQKKRNVSFNVLQEMLEENSK